MASYDFIVGTFNTPSLYTLSFTPSASKNRLRITKRHDAVGSHSWLALSANKKNLYATAWTEPPTVAAYSIQTPTEIKLLNTASTNSRSGYVCCSNSHVYSAGGATGEVFAIDSFSGALVSPSTPYLSNGSNGTNGTNGVSTNGASKLVKPVQLLDFVSDQPQKDDGSTMDFGGLRHGSHSADLSLDGRYLYIADIGRNCVWTYCVNGSSSCSSSPNEHLTLLEKHISPRTHDGPRHAWPHPNGKVLYVLQEHSSMVDVFAIDGITGHLTHIQGVRIVPREIPVNEFWADEVRTSFSNGDNPKYLYASTRGLKAGRKGYLAVYKLNDDGIIDGAKATSRTATTVVDDQDQGGLLCMYETVTSGGWANAVQPGPTIDGVEYLALTDSEVGYVFVLAWDGQEIREVGRIDLNDDSGLTNDQKVVGAATAVWL